MCEGWINYHVKMMDKYFLHAMHVHTCRLDRVVMCNIVSLLRLRGSVAETPQS